MPSENDQAKIERLRPLKTGYPGFPGSVSTGRTHSLHRCLPTSPLGVAAAKGVVLGPGRGVSRLLQGANLEFFFYLKWLSKVLSDTKGRARSI